MKTLAAAPVAPDCSPSQQTGVTVERIAYHGWPDCFKIQNGFVEAIVIPAVGRVMQLRLLGDAAGTFWENRALDGQLHPQIQNQWLNFGGDKCWPAPQADWPQLQGRDWPPPAGFDARPMDAAVTEYGVELSSPADSSYGIQVVRHVELEIGRPVLRIRTEFRKVIGSPVRVGIWTIAQMQNPERACMHLPVQSNFAAGYVHLREAEPAGLKIGDGILSLGRHPSELVKIGSDAHSLAWVGATCSVRIDAEQGPGEYPEGGCVTQIYTNPEPLQYVELETLGPLANMSIGNRIERTTLYTVFFRTMPNPEAEARKILND
ncbi:MAG: hypothetical protein P4K86_08730 [Terracidiphilus sp.]|nr:hypothetical protein [Terracidiphilus sp.]